MKTRDVTELNSDGVKIVSHNIQRGFDSTTKAERSAPLPYRSNRGKRVAQTIDPNASPTITGFGLDSQNASVFNRKPPGFDSYRAVGMNSAYADFRQRVYDGAQAQLLAFLGEAPQAFAMIARRSLQMRSAYKQLRRGDLPGMFRTLGVEPRNKRHKKGVRRGSNDLAGGFLEISYGWLPAIGDIVSACEVLGSTIGYGAVMGSKGDRHMFIVSIRSNQPCPSSDLGEDAYVMSRFKVGANVLVTNPNSALLGQLGLINPVALGWELIPYSFLVDQVLNVQQFIESWTDFYGMDLSHQWFGESHRTIRTFGRRACPYPGRIEQAFDVIDSLRSVGAYKPTLTFGGAFGLVKSARRVANNLALLVALLTGTVNPSRVTD